tara:strand:+ start:6548 stop:7702 length:1155 start_codon:yes stop_codon:yes gene_type:complete
MIECYSCKSKKTESIFKIDECPIAGNFLSDTSKDELIPLDVLFCNDCGLVQVDKNMFVPKEKLFVNYFYKTHCIKTLVDFFYEQAEEINDGGGKKVLEIGGNSCPLGEKLIELGNEVINVDPSNVAKNNKPDGLILINDFFNNKVASSIKEKYNTMDVVYSANNFAHMEDLFEVIEGIKTVLSEDGELIIQVQDLEYLLDELCFPFFYHEHLFYYNVQSLEHLLSNFGFELIRTKRNKIHGGSLNCVFKKSNSITPTEVDLTELKNKINKFGERVDEVQNQVLSFIKGKKVVAYGASGQANIMFAKFGITNKDIPYIIDDAPLKKDKYTPYSHIQIKDLEFLKEYEPDYIFLTAYNFFDEIKNKNKWFKGKWIVPLPYFKVVEE